MNQPLTSKFMGKKIHPDFTITDDGIYCLESDVKSAVEWLKLEIKKNTDAKRRVSYYTTSDLYKLIDSAFPDLCPMGDLIADKQNPQKDLSVAQRGKYTIVKTQDDDVVVIK